jgi:predicted dithiol-disulfide oxidoreductase (DUF899 family)
MPPHTILPHEQWIEARKQLLAKEKEFTRLRDELSRQRRELPWEQVEKDYVFEGSGGKATLADLFDGRGQLLVYHFMFDPEWNEGCKSCSFLADHYDHSIIHLEHRDVTMVTVSRAPLHKLEAFKQRMGWNFKWVSSFESDFNRDYHVSFTPAEQESKKMYYNYRLGMFPASEGPGISAFRKSDDGDIFHTYSAYARGLDLFIGAYNLLDITPKGRDEDNLPYGMEWVRHHDRYDDKSFTDPYVELLPVKGTTA